MRPDYCPLWNEPCQKGCEQKCGTMNAWEVLRKENETLRARVDELHSQPCSDCGAPSEPATICPSCSTARCVDLGRTEWAKHTARCTDCHEPTGPIVVCEACAMARCESVAAAQRQRDAEICRQIHSTSRQRTELALLCARMIE